MSDGPQAAPPAVKRGSVLSSARLNLIGRIAYMAAQWLLLVALARLGSPEAVGAYTLALAVSGPFALLFGLDLRSAVSTDHGHQVPVGGYLALALVSGAAALGCAGAFSSFSGYEGSLWWVVVLVTAAKVFEQVGLVIHGVWQRDDRFREIAWSMIAWGGVTLVLGAGTMALTGSIVATAFGVAASRLVVLFVYDLPRIRDVADRALILSREVTLPLVRSTLPLGMILALTAVNVAAPRYVIERSMSLDVLAYYGVSEFFVQAGSAIIGSLGHAVLPALAAHMHAGDLAGFRRLLRKVVGLVAGACAAGAVGAMVLGGPVLNLMYGAPYGEYASLLTALWLAGSLRYIGTIVGIALVATRRFDGLIGPSVVATTANLLVALWAVPTLGLYGGALATGVSGLILLLARSWVLSRTLAEVGAQAEA